MRSPLGFFLLLLLIPDMRLVEVEEDGEIECA
jgi:hypothetical protein